MNSLAFIIPALELYQTKQLFIKANSARNVVFTIIPTKLNFIKIRAKAESALAGDIVEHFLPVKVTTITLVLAP